MKTLITSWRQILRPSGKSDLRGVQRFNYTAAAFRCALLALGLLYASDIAQAQQTDPLTITPDGKVGIGTTGPANKLSVGGNADVSGSVGIGTTDLGTSKFKIANSSADFAHFRFDFAGAGQLEFVGWASGWNINSKTAGKNLYLNRDSDSASDVLIGHFGREMMIKGDSGNVGIGTASPQSALTVGKSTGGGNYAQDATSGWRDGYMLFRAGTQRASIGMDDSGTKLQLFTGPVTNDTTARLTVDSRGYVGIGTNAPTKGKVEIVGSSNAYRMPLMMMLRPDGSRIPLMAGQGQTDISLYADGAIAAPIFYAFSDERIKRIGHRSDMARDLATLMGIEVVDYSYIDLSKGAGAQKKVTGQQLEKVFPQAVSTGIDVVPDIYKQATIRDGWIVLTTNLKKGERVRLIGEKQESIQEVLEVAEGRFRTSFAAESGRVFVYGREVNDARRVDYEAISMLNVSATQRIKKEKDAEVKALQDENAALRSQIAAQEKRLAELEAKDKARDEKLVAIESLLSRQQPSNRSASVKKVN